jgi:hypothetical protein
LFDIVTRPAPGSGASEDPDDAFAGAQAYIYYDRSPMSLCADGRLAAKRIDLVAEGSRPELFTLIRASVALDAADAHGPDTDEWEMVSLSRAERRLTSHIVGTWENQRWAPMRGWTPSVENPPAWSDISGRHVLPLGSFALGPAWTWESEWAADLSVGAPKSDGWSYATGFELSRPGGTDWGAKTMRSMVRRRRWVRYRQRPSRAPGDDGWSTSGAAAAEPEHDKWGRAWNGGCAVEKGASSPKTVGAASDVARTTEWALEDFYRRMGEPGKLDPGKIATLRRRYAGREKELVLGLWNKYGCVPEIDPHPPAPALPPRTRGRGSSTQHARALSVGASAGQGVRAEADQVVRGIGSFLRVIQSRAEHHLGSGSGSSDAERRAGSARRRNHSAAEERGSNGSGGGEGVPRMRGPSFLARARAASKARATAKAKANANANANANPPLSAAALARMQALLAKLDECIAENLARCAPPEPSDVVNARGKLQRGEQCAARGEHADALEFINESLDLDARNAKAYLDRSEANLRLGNRAGALSDVHVCTELLRHPGETLAPLLVVPPSKVSAAPPPTPPLTALPAPGALAASLASHLASHLTPPTAEAQLLVAAARQKTVVLAALGLADRGLHSVQ